ARARGQNPAVDSRWLAYLGGWESIEWAKSLVCLVPAAGGGTPAVDLVTITKGQVVTRERITPSGERVATRHDDCTGWQSAEWSGTGARLFLRSGDTCPPPPATGPARVSSAWPPVVHGGWSFRALVRT